MVVATVFVQVKPEHIKDFIEETVKNHQESIKEPGNMRFDVLQSSDDPASFLLYEAYDSEDSAAAHKKTAHYLAWRDAVADWMAEPRKAVKYKAIRP
ncbi:MAG TPA: antibiotic biosynthesis monooxygenase [Chitinispirillaceae bacterium]|jgi:autoinducer 2-degrading protein|nr:antibiotic biosynthesis monooxygenase [Chitinispirillaceae bacterium]